MKLGISVEIQPDFRYIILPGKKQCGMFFYFFSGIVDPYLELPSWILSVNLFSRIAEFFFSMQFFIQCELQLWRTRLLYSLIYICHISIYLHYLLLYLFTEPPFTILCTHFIALKNCFCEGYLGDKKWQIKSVSLKKKDWH